MDIANAQFEKASHKWDQGQLRSAFRLFLLAAKNGDRTAQHNLGYFYDLGIGVKANRAAALHWYKMSFRRGSRVAANNIATIFRDDKNFKQALIWFERAVELGDDDANLEIAKIYVDKFGDVAKAIPYLKRTIRARAENVTEASKSEAQRLLDRYGKSKPKGG